MSEMLAANDMNFDSEVMQSDQPVLVDFSATWCAPCKKLEPILHEIAGDYSGRLKVVKVDVEEAPQTAAKFGVMAVPTVLLMKDGAVKDQMQGIATKQAIADRIDKVL